MSRWSTWSRGLKDKPRFISNFVKEALDTGNPSVGSSPAERARQLGLQSDGSGGYIDPETGQKVAATVNGELVFYDNRGQGGGAVSDGSGGAELANAQPSWSDPATGMAITPPSRPESPEEQLAVPDPIPASAPAGYDSFMNDQRMRSYAQKNAANMQNNVDQAAVTPHAAGTVQGINPIGPDGNVMGGSDIEGVQEGLGDNKELRDKAGILPNKGKTFAQMRQQLNTPEPQQQEPQMTDRQKSLAGRLDQMSAPSTLSKGAGANRLSREDIGSFQNYIKNGPQNETEDVSPEELEFAMGYLKDGAGKKWTGFQNRLKGKGDPEPARKVVSRSREVVESYLRNLGQSAVDGSALNFSDSELDHGVSLSNGGLDQGDNWRWLPKRFNQFKGDLDDDSLLEKLQKELDIDPADENLKQQERDTINQARDSWKDSFDKEGWENWNVADIKEKTGAHGLQFLKALAEKSGVSYYKNRDGARASGRAGGGTALGVEELQTRLIDQLGIPESVDVENFDKSMFDVLQQVEDGRSDLDSAKRARRKEKRDAKRG